MSLQLVSEGAPTDPAPTSALECLVIVASQHGLHFTITQLVQDNLLSDQNVSIPQLIKCAENSGMKAKAVKLDWPHLAQLKKALPAIVWLRNGASMVLLSVDGDPQNIRVTLRDPNAADDALLGWSRRGRLSIG